MKSMKYARYSAAILAALAASSSLFADDPTPPLTGVPNNTTVQTQLTLPIKDETKEVHFIQTNNDGDVFTKVYVLKHADPYELRPYLAYAIGGDQFTAPSGLPGNINTGRRINTHTTKVECIKYADGTGMLLVSAELYRFTDPATGMPIDKIIEILDQPKITSCVPEVLFLYLPKYWRAIDLNPVIQRVGMDYDNDVFELRGGKDLIRTDDSLNALFFRVPAYSVKRIQRMLDLYDTPISEAVVNYTIYEVESEIDDVVGSDFQAWKNGPGTDLFSAGARYTNGWDINSMTPARPYVNNSHARLVNVSPKWNTKYLDFLSSKGKAKVMTSGALSIANNKTATLDFTNSIATITTGADRTDGGVTALSYYNTVSNTYNQAVDGAFRITAGRTAGGVNVTTIAHKDGTAIGAGELMDFTATNATVTYRDSNGNTRTENYYYLQVNDANFAFFDANGKNLGHEVRLYDVTIQTYSASAAAWASATWTSSGVYNAPIAIQKAAQRLTSIVSISPDANSYGFSLTLTPTVCDDASTVAIQMTNTNLIGFNSDGSIRVSKTDLKTKVNVNNNGEKFLVGGLDKEDVVRSKSSVPYLGTIPVLGWAFTSEREVHKKSQLLAVIECIPVIPETQVPAGIMSEISEAKEKIKNYGVKVGPFEQNDLGFDQYLLDSEKKGIDPLP